MLSEAPGTESGATEEQRLTVAETCAYLGVSRTALYDWLDRGYLSMLPAPTYFGRPRRYFSRAELDRFKREGRRVPPDRQLQGRVAEEGTPYNAAQAS